MPLGNPIRKQNESRIVSVLATEGQTVFTVQGGYIVNHISCLLYTSPSPRDRQKSRMPSSA